MIFLLRNLALLLQDQGEYAQAEGLFLEALDIYRTQFGEGHVHLQDIYAHLIELYKAWKHPHEVAQYQALLDPLAMPRGHKPKGT